MPAQRSKSRAISLAISWSFLIYVIPLVHRHGVIPLAILIGGELAGSRPTEEPLWVAADIGMALCLQIVMGVFLYWVFSGRARFRAWGIVAVFPVLAVAANPVYQVYIPQLFLIEPETHAESGDWPTVCELKDFYLRQTRSGITLDLERAGETYLVHAQSADPALLKMPGCQVVKLRRPEGAKGGTIRFGATGGQTLFQELIKATGKIRDVFVGSSPGQDRVPPLDSDGVHSAILSSDGTEVIWLHRLRAPDRRLLGHEIRRMKTATGDISSYPLSPVGPRSLDLLSEDPDTRHLLIARNGHELISVDGTGKISVKSTNFGDFQIGTGNIRWFNAGWAVWDGYRESGRHRVAWEIEGVKGLHEIPKGRGITSISVSPSGRLIAISVTTILNIGSVRDAVYVLRTSDGREVFRRFLKTYSRSPVAFLGDEFFAYSYLAEDKRGRVRVLRVPDIK